MPGTAVTLNWRVSNTGNADIFTAWQDHIQVRNLSTGQLVASADLPYTPEVDGKLVAGGFVDRAYTLTWPLGANAAGRFEFVINTDYNADIFENNLQGTAETNNPRILTVASAPDLVVRNLRTEQATTYAGGLVNLSWQTWNEGLSVVPASFNEHIIVTNKTTGEQLLNTSIAYDFTQAGAGLIASGEFRVRSYNFRLPDGLRGVGEIEIRVVTNQNVAGQSALFEYNAANTANSNNSASTLAQSTAVPYADLRVANFTAPVDAVSGEAINVSWSVANNGSLDTPAAWDDQIILSSDSIIGNSNDVVIGTYRHNGSLKAGETYTRTVSVNLPFKPTGRYYLAVKSDSGSEVLEPDTRPDNTSLVSAIDLQVPYADLAVANVTAPQNALSGENILVTWEVNNNGNAKTDLALWNDRVVLSRDASLSSDDIILSGSITHAGQIAPGQGYLGKAILTLPKDLAGDYYVIVDTNTNRSVYESGYTANNIAASVAKLNVGLSPVADLTLSDVTGPLSLRPGEPATVTYTTSNSGEVAAVGPWRDRIFLDIGSGILREVANSFNQSTLPAGASETRRVTFTLPVGFAEGEFRWVVKTDTDNTVYERSSETNNTASSAASVHVARIDLAVTSVTGPSLVQSGSTAHVEWAVANNGATATGGWVDQLYLSKNGSLVKIAELARSGQLLSGESYTATADFIVPLEYNGEYELIVIADAAKAFDDRNQDNNRSSVNMSVDLAPFADLTVSQITAPTQIIDDPAPVDIAWTVTNQGTGAGLTSSWMDRIVLSSDDTLGNRDDIVVGEFLHEGALASGESYSRAEHILLAARTAGRYKLFVVSDARGQVFENFSESNNVGQATQNVDVMPIPYADLQVLSVTTQGSAASGKPLSVSWEVVNNGIGITNVESWGDRIWLSRNADGTGVVAELGSASHIGKLAVGDRYARSLNVTLPEGLSGNYYVNIGTGGPFEFIYDKNNTGTSVAIPVELSKSPDLVVESITLPALANEGGLIDVSWTVVNQGDAPATGLWVDNVYLIPVGSDSQVINLGSFAYDRSLASGIRYTRTEQVRLPTKIDGLYRVKVVSNANLGKGVGSQVYEYGIARDNNVLVSVDTTEVKLNDRPDLRVGTVIVPDQVTAGTGAGIRYTITNQGPAAATGRWTDKVFLSLDGILSADDKLVGQFENGSALASSESYANETGLVNIPIQYRGDAYLIVVADGNFNVDEFPDEANNVRAARFYVDPVPFGDLVTSDVVAPDQAVYGSNIEVRYKVTNKGSDTTRGEAATTKSWTDTVWLSRNKLQPGAYKGDILLGSFTHVGNLAVGEDYLGTVEVSIPNDVLTGSYFITVWSDTYNTILEDTLASNINTDDPTGIDNNNYKARPIGVLGHHTLVPPDLVVREVSGVDAAEAGGSYSFSYTVQNRGEMFAGQWTDVAYITDNPDFASATEIWEIGRYTQNRSLGNNQEYSVSQTVQLAPSVKGRYLVVRTDLIPRSQVAKSNENNNTGSDLSVVTTRPADLKIIDILTQPENFSGEETTVSWTVVNQGHTVWPGTKSWNEIVYISKDPTFIPGRATVLGGVEHSNIQGLAAGESFTTSTKVKLPPGTDGQYYIYVFTDTDTSGMPKSELIGNPGRNDGALEYYASTVFEAGQNANNSLRGSLNITYREPDLKVESIVLSDPNLSSGQSTTVTWTVKNQGTRATRNNAWFDGIYLSRDASLDSGDYPIYEGITEAERKLRVKLVSFYDGREPKYLNPGESYTYSAQVRIPESISGDFHLIVKADTNVFIGSNPYEKSTIREDLPIVKDTGGSGIVPEFQDEANNMLATTLHVTLATPPDLQVASVTAPETVLAGQKFTVNYQVVNTGGDTPNDQRTWYDLVYFSKDRFLDVRKDSYLGLYQRSGGLAAGGSYDASLTLTAPRNLEGPYYVFVVTDPVGSWGSVEFGNVREFGKEQNNSLAAAQPILLETPPPADLIASDVLLPASAIVGDEIQVDYTVTNNSINPAFGRWTDSIYLSSDNAWDLGDILLGKVDHDGGLDANASYGGSLKAKLPPLKDGNWRVIVRPDLYNEVFEGKITYTATGLNLPPQEANNRTASGATLQVKVPVLALASPLQTTLSPGQSRLYKVSVAAGETLRVLLDSSKETGANEIYIRYGDVPTSYLFDASYTNPLSADQQALIPSTLAGDYYVLVRSNQGSLNTPATLRADLLPLAITKVTPDQGGTGDDNHRWVTFDIYGAHFKAGALVKLSRPGVFETEPVRWQVLDATHIRAIFDLRNAPHGLYDVSVINPDGQQVTDALRYLVERGIEADVTIGIGGPRTVNPGDIATYSVSLQSLTNVDTPYVRFDVGAPDMGNSENLLKEIGLPYVVFGSNIGGQADGVTLDTAGNTQAYGITQTNGTVRKDIPWAQLDGSQNTAGFNLAPGYALDVGAGGFIGATFNVQTYPGLAEWLNYDFPGLRDKLYALRPDWKAQGLLDGGISDLNKISSGLAQKFLDAMPDDGLHLTKLEILSMPFRFNVVGAATPITRDEFIADQTQHATRLRTAILADTQAPTSLSTLAADEAQWVAGWLGALEAAGLLRPLEEAAPIRENPKVVSLNATLASGILLSKAGDSYRTQADILGFFAKVQQWYGDTARYAGDAGAVNVGIEYFEERKITDGVVNVPVPVMADPADFGINAAADTHFINFNIFAGGTAQSEYLRHIGVLDKDFRPVSAQALNLSQYLEQAAQQNASANAFINVSGPQAITGNDGNNYVPVGTALPYTISFTNPAETAAGQLRIVSEIDADLDIRSLRLGDLKVGDFNVHVPTDRANFQADFDFSGNKGFILRVSAGIDASSRIATWLMQAIDPDTGEVLQDATRGLLLPPVAGDLTNSDQYKRGFVSYTIPAFDTAAPRAEIVASARIFVDELPPIESEKNLVTLDAKPPVTTLTVTSQGNNGQGASSYDVSWTAVDAESGIKSVTVYAAEDGRDFKIWLRQVDPAKTQAIFTGEAGKTYEFLAVATDKAGNREAATLTNAALPDDGSQQEALDSLGVNQNVNQTAEFPLAAADRSYAANALFQAAKSLLPGHVATVQKSDLNSVLAPFTVRGFADGYQTSAADIGALAMVELADQSVLASAGNLRNEVFLFDKEGGRSTTPLFTLDSPVLDMAVDQLGQLWVMTGAELLQIDANSGAVVRRPQGPGQDPLTHALAIQPITGDIYVSSGNGIEIYRPNEADTAKSWKHFSNQRASDLAFSPDGRLWAVTWTGSEVTSSQANPTTDIVSFPMSGRTIGRAELEYRLSGVIDSIAFGANGTPLAGLLITSSNLKQRPVVEGQSTLSNIPHQASVWMVELTSKQVLQLAGGGTQGESIVTTADGRILVAQTGHIDVIAPRKAPTVQAITVPDGSLLPLPMAQIGVVFDQDIWTGEPGRETSDAGSVLNASNFTLTVLGANAGATISPQTVRWDAATRTAWLDVNGLAAGQYQLNISSTLQNSAEIRMEHGYVSTFTALLDMTSQVKLDFTNTRADRATGQVSYDVSLTNIGTDDLKGSLTLLLDPGRYFNNAIDGATTGGGDQADLWTIDLSAALQANGGNFAVGATITGQTITVTPASVFATRAGMADLVKFNLGHGVYAVPQANLPPVLTVAGTEDTDLLSSAVVGEAWNVQIESIDRDGALLYWELVQAPVGVTLTPHSDITTDVDGYHAVATLDWTPTIRDAANTEIIVRVQDSRGGVATRRFQLPVIGGNNAPVVDAVRDIALHEGEALSIPMTAADADGDALTLTIRNLPGGAVFDAASGMLSWIPGYDQAGVYQNITIIASDGKTTVSQRFNVTVGQGYAKPVLGSVSQQTLREGDRYALQLAGNVAGSEAMADGTTVKLTYSAPWLPGGATLNTQTGWMEWTPGYNQHGLFHVPVTLTALWTTPGSDPVSTSVTKEIVFNVLNANGSPVFDAVETWNTLEGQPLQISVFAFDPENPDFEPRIRAQAGATAGGPETTAATVSYDVVGLPLGATFDPETLDISWTPGYGQAGIYSVTVTATDNGDGTGVPAINQLVLPIVVANANRAPEIGDIGNAFVDKGSALEIPVSVLDADGNPVQVTISGLPRFATYTQDPSSGNGSTNGVIRFAPGTNDRGDYTITVVAQDNGDGNVNQVLTQAKSFVLTVRSVSEAPVITAPRQVVAVAGQPLSVALLANDSDQDALTWSANGLPIGAELTAAVKYGHATLKWTPSVDDIGTRDIELVVTDSGLSPANAGYVQPETPVPNVTKHTIRVVVRDANAAPEMLGVQVNGVQVADTGLPAMPIQLNASEGVPLTIDLFGRDTDTDLIEWSVSGLPRGMMLEVPSANNGNRAVLKWTPDLLAAQNSNATIAGQWRFTVRGSDGATQFERSFEIQVANTNQTPRLLPVPLQLVSEGETVSFTIRSLDPDNDTISTSLVYDSNTPAGVLFDGATGYFEWTPDQNVVNGALENNHPYTFTFQVNDGSATSTQTVQVRVFDVNRIPQLVATNHAVVVGQSLSIPVQLGGMTNVNGITATDPDGAQQTDALAISFANLPEGASYDALTKRLTWIPGPGQIGDFTVTAKVSDGKNTAARTFTLRVVAEEAANQPKITVSTTPGTPALPGQTIIASVRADAWSGIENIVTEIRGSGLGNNAGDTWQIVSLDGAGRMKLLPTQPGLIEVRVTVTDRDGFVGTQSHVVRIKDSADTTAPILAWTDVLGGASSTTQPVAINQVTVLTAGLSEQQLMGYKLELAPVGSDAWQTLAEHDDAAISISQIIDLVSLDPSKFANGVYQLRLSAWDLVGRTTEIGARVVIDTAQKDLAALTATDNTYSLAGRNLAFNRMIETTPSGMQTGDLGNWKLALLDTGLTTDQPATTASGATAPWQEGARVWLQIPESLSSPTANTLSLSFTLDTVSERLGSGLAAPQVFHPVFSQSQGWQLLAHTSDAASATENLMRQGGHLYDQITGLPWVPTSYTLIAPDSSRYSLDANGKITAVTYSDGAQWLISDAGIVAVNEDSTQRVDIQRDSQARISRVMGLNGQGETISTVYHYDAQGRLTLVRNLNSNDMGTPIAYDAQGKPFTGSITARLGAAVNWLGNSGANQWTGTLTNNSTTTLAFNVRESELNSTVHTPGAQGAVIYAIETELPQGATIE
jgi:subtilase family serine protease